VFSKKKIMLTGYNLSVYR